MTGRLDGKIALITGAAGGIGSAIARAFVGEGARVAVTDRDGAAVDALATELNGIRAGAALSCRHDVTSQADWDAALEAAEKQFGGLSVLVNNAGVAMIAPIEDTSFEDWRRLHDVNLDAVFLGTKAALPYLRASAPASIVNLSSVAGLYAGHNVAAYNSSKAAVWMLTRSVALSCARKGWNIRANSIHPTFIETGMVRGMFAKDGEPRDFNDEFRDKLTRQIPLHRLCTVEDVAYAAIYLASDESAIMTGAEIKLDGGLSAM